MANSFYSKFLDFIGIEETDDGDDYYDDRDRDRSYGRNSRNDDRYDRNDRNDRYSRDQDDDDSVVSYSGRKNSKEDKRGKKNGNQESDPASAAGLPIYGGQKMIVYHPVCYEDTQSIIDNMKNRKPVIVNMEELDVETAQRILDFLSGAVYAIDGTMCKISRNIFVVAPNSYDVIGNGNEAEYGDF